MTFWAQRNIDRPELVDVHVTHGPISISVSEDPGYLRSFWGELGRLLNDAEHGTELETARVRSAFEAYCESTGGLNVRGEEVPPWDGLGEPVQEAWRAAARNLTG
jgi:hypothetical protein